MFSIRLEFCYIIFDKGKNLTAYINTFHRNDTERVLWMCLGEAKAKQPLLPEWLPYRNKDLLQAQTEVNRDTTTPAAISRDSYPQHHVRR